MSSQRDVQNRIASVQNIRKITRAMEMVAAARLRRAEQRIEHLRPYADAIRRMTRQAAEAAELPGRPGDSSGPDGRLRRRAGRPGGDLLQRLHLAARAGGPSRDAAAT